jgi:type IV pilus assembly protein PilQ
MRKWTMTAGLLFSAAAAVYSSQAIGANPAKATKPGSKEAPTDVKVLEGNLDPFAPTKPTTAPSSQPTAAWTTADTSTAPPAQMHLNTDGSFSLNIVSGADIVEQLRVIGFQAQMSIIPSKEVHGALPAIDLYNVTVQEALDALLHANGYAWRQKGNFIYVYSAKELAEMEKAQRVMNTEVFRLSYTPAANAANMIKPVLSSDAQVSLTAPALSGIESGAKDVGGNSHATDDMLVVTDYPENLDRVRLVIKELDRRPQQILIEATIMRAALTDDNALGVDFNIVGGVDFSTITSVAGQITNANLPDPLGPDANSVGTGNNFTKGINNGLKVGVVTNNVSVFVAALEGVTDTSIMANPKVLALNKQKGEVIVGRKDGYLTTTVTESTATQTVEFLDTGTRLIFRPFIGNDGFIRMEIHPEDSSGGLTADNLPFKVTTEVTSNVMVKDGHTIVIGGLFRESSTRSRSQVPLLGSIPLAGYLFRNQSDNTVREEVIILLTPHIIKDDGAYSQLSEEQLKNAERMRVGVRRGMMPFGRERMADGFYQCALKAMDGATPDRKKAIFFLDAAIGLNPKLIEAINLKQELTGEEVTAADGSSIRGFVRKSVMVDLPGPSTQPSAQVPSTQPLAESESSDVESYAAAPSTQPSDYPMDEKALSELSDYGNSQFHPVNPGMESALTEADLRAMTPAIDEEDLPAMTPAIEPMAMHKPSPSTQPTAGKFGVSGLAAKFSMMMKKSGDENAPKTSVTEVSTEEVPVGSSGNDE